MTAAGFDNQVPGEESECLRSEESSERFGMAIAGEEWGIGIFRSSSTEAAGLVSRLCVGRGTRPGLAVVLPARLSIVRLRYQELDEQLAGLRLYFKV